MTRLVSQAVGSPKAAELPVMGLGAPIRTWSRSAAKAFRTSLGLTAGMAGRGRSNSQTLDERPPGQALARRFIFFPYFISAYSFSKLQVLCVVDMIMSTMVIVRMGLGLDNRDLGFP